MTSFGGKAQGLIRLMKAGYPVPAFGLVRRAHQEKDLNNLKRFLKAGECYAVRSSAGGEDSQASAMAGLFETYLEVPAQEVAQKVADVFKSAQAPRVKAFLKEKKLPAITDFTVVVQRMIPAEVSGILFTVNPQGILNEYSAVVGFGTGDGVVQDEVPTSSYFYHEGDGLEIAQHQPGAPKLTKRARQELWKLAKRLEDDFNQPMDAEFAFAQGRFWLLQARPVTSLGQEIISLDSSNITESYPGLACPLTLDFAKAAYEGVFTGLLRRVVGPKASQPLKPIVANMVAASSGRLYYHINNWYALMKRLPFHGLYIPLWQDMMGIKDRRFPEVGAPLSSWQQLKGALRLAKELRGNQLAMDRLDDEFKVFQENFWRKLAGQASRQELLALFEAMREKLLTNWDLTLINDMRAFIRTGLAKAVSKDSRQVLQGVGDLASLEPVRQLSDLAHRAPKNLMNDFSEAEFLEYLMGTDGYAKELRQYIQVYGDRYLEELKLEAKTFRTNPEYLLPALRALAKSPRVQGDQGIRPLNFLQRRAAEAIRHRESSRLNRSRIFGMARSLFLALGDIMARQGQLEEARDVFWLNLSEVQGPGQDFRGIIQERKADYELYEQLPAYSRLEFAGAIFDRVLPRATQTGEAYQRNLQGQGASPGIVSAEVIRILDPRQPVDVTGKILVCRQTDPGWVFLLASCAGLIAEKGSLLSHTAIIARELGKPAVVGVPQVLSQLKDGEMVELDGQRGRIRRLDEKQ